jgi:small subunit ribosomal protein S27Ae
MEEKGMSQSQKRKKEKKVHTYYDISGGKIVRRLKKCPRCGVFMAFHKENKARWTCGKCSYTEYVS